MLGLLPPFALKINSFLNCFQLKKTALLLTNQNGEIFFMYIINIVNQLYTCPLFFVREATLSEICFCFAATKFIRPCAVDLD